MFKLPINTLFTLCSLSPLISDKEFRQALLMDLLLDWYVKFISQLSSFPEFKLLVLAFSDKRIILLKDRFWMDSKILKTNLIYL